MNKKIDENNNIVDVTEPSTLSVSINGVNNNIVVNNSAQSTNSRISINGNNNKILIGKCTIKSFQYSYWKSSSRKRSKINYW